MPRPPRGRRFRFDLVFVFAITQLTSLLAHEPTVAGLARVTVVFGNLWWMYGAYAWLTNNLPPRQAALRLLLLLGMAGFLVAAALWWLFFDREDERAERALRDASDHRTPWLALYAFGYAFLPVLGGIIGATGRGRPTRGRVAWARSSGSSPRPSRAAPRPAGSRRRPP